MLVSVFAYEHMGRMVVKLAVRTDSQVADGGYWRQLPNLVVQLPRYATYCDALEGLAEELYGAAGAIRDLDVTEVSPIYAD